MAHILSLVWTGLPARLVDPITFSSSSRVEGSICLSTGVHLRRAHSYTVACFKGRGSAAKLLFVIDFLFIFLIGEIM